MRKRAERIVAEARRFLGPRWEVPFFGFAIALKGLVFLPAAGIDGTVGSQHWITLGMSLLLVGWTAWLPTVWRRRVLVLEDATFTFLVVSNLWYFRYFGDVLSLQLLVQAFQVGTVGDSIFNLARGTDALFLADFPIFVLISRKLRAAPHPTHSIALAAVCVALGAFLVALPVGQRLSAGGGGMFQNFWSKRFVVRKCGLAFYHGLDLYHFCKDQLFSPSPTEPEQLQEWDHQHAASTPVPPRSELAGKAAGLNLIIVQVEAAQAQVLGFEVDGQPLTPRLNALAEESLVFDRFFHQAAEGRTSDAEFAVLCSQHPLLSGSVYFRFPGVERRCLPRQLADAGYTTVALHSYQGAFWNRLTIYPNLGFSRFDAEEQFEPGEVVGLGLSDEEFLAQSLTRLEDLPEPFFSFIITLSSHHPFHIPESHRELSAESVGDDDFADYLHSMRYTDRALGQFIDGLDERGLLEKSVVVVYGDHDMGTIESIDRARDVLMDGAEGAWPSLDFERRIPLLIRVPGVQGRQFTHAGGQVDLMPTLLELLGLPTPTDGMFGRSMLSAEGPPAVVFRNGSAVDDGRYWQAADSGLVEEGSCWSTVDGSAIPRESCTDIAERAKLVLSLSDQVVRFGPGLVSVPAPDSPLVESRY